MQKSGWRKQVRMAFLQLVASPALRYAPGMSLTAQKPAQLKMAAFINGDWFGGVTDWKKTDSSMILDYTTSALPYRIGKTKQRAGVCRLERALMLPMP
jgi:hypothetical protein